MPTTVTRTRKKIEYGDFQTPSALAREVCRVLSRLEITPSAILEPTCGRGALLEAAADQFPEARQLVGLDVNPEYVRWAERQMKRFEIGRDVVVETKDFFAADWPNRLVNLDDPLLLIGNPPWVTNSVLGGFSSDNLPEKRNANGLRGIEALTGKSNFDISEWMLLRMLEWMRGRDATLAMLCKTSVARKVLHRGWLNGERWKSADIFGIDALQHFAASVDACLLVIRGRQAVDRPVTRASVFASLTSSVPDKQIGLIDNLLLADVTAYEHIRHLLGRNPIQWRSGVKHDCSKVLELHREGAAFRNGLGELVNLEPDYVFPMLKSSHVASGKTDPTRWMLVTQRTIGEDTTAIERTAPRTWAYLTEHSELLSRRASSIYRGRPAYSVFGVGDYTFAPWKVATSGLYKQMRFEVVAPVANQPVVLDDTCYFLPCASEIEARQLSEMLNSDVARRFFEAFIFWDAKRPITVETLQRLDLAKLAAELQIDWQPLWTVSRTTAVESESQLSLFP